VQVARRFEDLAFWQQARELTRAIYALTQKDGFAKDYGLKDQVQRAAVSVMSNIAEGFSRGTNVEFLHFLFIAKGSLSEVQSQLYVALDLAYVTQDEFRHVYSKADQVAKTMNAFIQSVKRTGRSGLKARKEKKYVSFREEVEKLLDE
jgi:four helix bundle protein